jgi:hypothetical protein
MLKVFIETFSGELAKLPLIIGVAVLTAWMTVRFSLQSFRRQKWWEWKSAAYERIIEALRHIVIASDEWEDDSMNMGESLSPERNAELKENWHKAKEELKRAEAIGGYLISKEALAALEAFRKRPRSNPHETPTYELHAETREAAQDALKKITALAKADLRV